MILSYRCLPLPSDIISLSEEKVRVKFSSFPGFVSGTDVSAAVCSDIGGSTDSVIVDSSSISFSVVSSVSGTLVVSGILAVSGEEVGDEDESAISRIDTVWLGVSSLSIVLYVLATEITAIADTISAATDTVIKDTIRFLLFIFCPLQIFFAYAKDIID